MEFKLNKIDTDVRQRINNATKEGKIHSKKGIAISKDNKDEGREKPKFKLSNNNSDKKKKILVQAVKKENIDVEVFREENEKEKEDMSRGRFIDVRK